MSSKDSQTDSQSEIQKDPHHLLKTPEFRISCAEDNPAKLHRTDSFLKRFVKSSKDNLAESCERLVRHIQKSPGVLKKKLLFSWSSDSLGSSKSGEKPVPPLRRKRSIKRKDSSAEKEDDSLEKERPKFFLYPESEEEKSPEVKIPKRNFAFTEEIPRSESVSVEDVDDIIRSEDNFRLLQERYLLKRRLKALESSFPLEDKSRSEESLVKFSSSDYLKNRRHRESVPDLGEGQGRLRLDRRPKKLKSSPPPDEIQVQRSLRLLPIRDNWGSDKQGLTESGISSNESHAQPDVSGVSLGVKCRLANFVNAPDRYKSGGREENAILVSAESLHEDPLAGQSTDWNNPRISDREIDDSINQGRVFNLTDDQEEDFVDSSVARPLKIRKISKETVDWDILQSEEKCRSENENGGTFLTGTKDTSLRKKESVKKVSFKRSLRLKKRATMKLAVKFIRLREKLILGLSAFAILFTIFLVMDLQLDLGYSGHHLVPSHGRIKFGDDPTRDTVYNNFRRKFLQRVNGSKEQSGGDNSGSAQTVKNEDGIVKNGERTEKPKVHDDFSDLLEFVISGDGVNVEDGVVRISGEDHTDNPTIGEIRKIPIR